MARLASAGSTSKFRPFQQADGTELAGEDAGIAYAAFEYTVTPEGDDPYDEIISVECRPLPGYDATLSFCLFRNPESFAQDMAAASAVIASLQFQNPTEAGDAPWDIGVEFREQSSGERYQLKAESSSIWRISIGIEERLQTGTVGSIDTAPDASNTLELVVTGDVGAIRVNGGPVVGPLDLSTLPGPGIVSIGAAFFAENTVEGAVTSYRDVQLWRLPGARPVATPGATPIATPQGRSRVMVG